MGEHVLFDTDIFIWAQRGNVKAAKCFDSVNIRHLSVQSYMELLQCVQNKEQHLHVKDFLAEFDFKILPFTKILVIAWQSISKNMACLLALEQEMRL